MIRAIGTIVVLLAGAFAPPRGSAPDPVLAARLVMLTHEAPGTAGISVVHVESGDAAAVKGDERFPMMSVYKLPIAIHALREVDAGRIDLAERVTLTAADRRPGASALSESIAKAGPIELTIREIVAEVVTKSDNAASDWLLRRVGGPSAVAATLRALNVRGVDVSRYELEFAADYYGLCCVAAMQPFSLDRFAAAVERLPPDARRRAARAYEQDPRDAATPAGFTALLTRLQRGELLGESSTAWLLELMKAMHARDGRLRAGLPPGTPVALRPGTSGTTDGIRAAHNDTGIVTLPGHRGHLAIAVFLKGSRADEDARDAAIARVARAAYEWGMARR